MSNEIAIKVPDIGGAQGVDVIELLVKVGDTIEVDSPLITLESDKASMEIPSPKAGTIKNIALKVGDKVSEGDTILTLSMESEEGTSVEKEATAPQQPTPEKLENKPTHTKSSQELTVSIPDIGGAVDVDVIEVMVKKGDQIAKDQSLVTLEGDKATMDIPSPATGVVKSISIKVGDKVAQGTAVLILETDGDDEAPVEKPVENLSLAKVETAKESDKEVVPSPVEKESVTTSQSKAFASPAIRRIAREFGVDLNVLKGSGRKGRICKEDLQAYIKEKVASKSNASGFSLPEMPNIDFSKFGTIESKPLNKIKRLTGVNVHRSWVTIPHVTQFDEADITDLESFRKEESNRPTDYKLTLLAFVTKALSKALTQYPQFNASLDASGENLIYKKYYNIGIAVETPNGLVVPVIKQVDTLSVGQIAAEMTRLSKKAREQGLMPADMSGGCFTISSLGGIGGTAFTPIVNSPEVAILGLSRSSIKPVYRNNAFVPRLMLPLSLSYDHRVIDGAEAARFTRYLADLLEDIRRITL